MKRVVIVGAGQAGLQVALSLRQGGYEDGIVLLGREPHPPYQRPPLSKQVLKGEWAAEKCLLRPREFFATQDIDFRPEQVAATVEPAHHQVTLEGGRVLDYDGLAICTGARPRHLRLAGSSLRGLYYLRSLEDALALQECLLRQPRLVIVGGGYIGLEVASSARALGCEVTVVEAQSRLMQRSALEPIAEFLLRRHRDNGVRIHLDRLLTEIHGGRDVRAVSLDDGTLIEADAVLTGVGVRPETDWLEGSGLRCGRGLRVDRQCRTSAPDVYGAGDVCESEHPLAARPVLLESVQNAVTQGRIVAANLLGENAAYDEVPWFWSEQCDCRLQMAGLPRAEDELVIRASGPTSMTVLSIGHDRLHAAQCINAPGDYMASRKLIAAGRAVDRDALTNPEQELKELL